MELSSLTAQPSLHAVICSVAASLPAGLEGPMIFMGLSIGENANRLVPRNRPAFDLLRTDRHRIDFAAVSRELSLLFLVHLDVYKLTSLLPPYRLAVPLELLQPSARLYQAYCLLWRRAALSGLQV